MKKKKAFDCVEMKNQIQAKLLAEVEQLGEAEVRRRHQEWLEKSDDPLAQWWRKVKAAQEARAMKCK